MTCGASNESEIEVPVLPISSESIFRSTVSAAVTAAVAARLGTNRNTNLASLSFKTSYIDQYVENKQVHVYLYYYASNKSQVSLWQVFEP